MARAARKSAIQDAPASPEPDTAATGKPPRGKPASRIAKTTVSTGEPSPDKAKSAGKASGKAEAIVEKTGASKPKASRRAANDGVTTERKSGPTSRTAKSAAPKDSGTKPAQQKRGSTEIVKRAAPKSDKAAKQTKSVARPVEPRGKSRGATAQAPLPNGRKGAGTKASGHKGASAVRGEAGPSEKISLGHLGDFVGFHLRLAQDASYRVFARHRDKDLIKPGRYPALAIIQLNPGISQSALGRAIARDKSTVSPLIKDLQNNGFINRKPSTNDRRSVTLALTKKGERTLAKLHDRAVEHENELDRLLGSAKSRLMSMLDKIITGLGAQAPN